MTRDLSDGEVDIVVATDVDGHEVLTARALALVDMWFDSPDPCLETWFYSCLFTGPTGFFTREAGSHEQQAPPASERRATLGNV